MGAFPTLGSLDLTTVCEDVRVEDKASAGFVDAGDRIPGLPGVEFDPEAPYAPLMVNLRTILKATTVDSNLAKITAELDKRGLVTLRWNKPNVGNVRGQVKQVARGIQQGDPTIYIWPLTLPSGSWQDNAESDDTGNPPSVTTGGSREIHDPTIIFSAAGTFKVTASDGTEYLVTAASGPVYPVTVKPAENTAVDDNGADVRDAVTYGHYARMRMEADTALTIATSVSCTVKWRNRHGS